jgi:hypothetical protein
VNGSLEINTSLFNGNHVSFMELPQINHENEVNVARESHKPSCHHNSTRPRRAIFLGYCELAWAQGVDTRDSYVFKLFETMETVRTDLI